ncbi:hypothetical protein [Turneriella parva]|uniref:Uncharacterized protein n=1 Tax=Turneriella parva (strain ATCC BAA-1111 / DSM 21527 / NCTC 11395 / H) TaxID=869212 RepID=I4B3U9_TURPD|nr:hypothetical protein [Turneriella parva]AFM11956.1 hypothetical protein Turpa_1308 [Turneriella parva DSM 21527]
MSDVLGESRRYFEARLADCRHAPHLHTEQIKTYEQYLSIIGQSSDAGDYAQKLGPLASMFAVARAEQMDKYGNLVRLYQKLGNPDKLKAALDRYETAKKAQNHGDLVGLMTTAQDAAAVTESKGNEKLNLAMTLLQCVVAYAAYPAEQDRSGKVAGILETYTALKNLDPLFTWQSYAETPYVYVVFFDTARMQRLGQIFEQVKA